MDPILILGVTLSLVVVLWPIRLERKIAKVLNILSVSRLRLYNQSYTGVIASLKDHKGFRAKRDCWVGSKYIFCEEGVVKVHNGPTFEGYSPTEEDAKATDWVLLTDGLPN